MSTHNQGKAAIKQHANGNKLAMAQFQSGPIPTADELRQLETVLSGLADRVVSMAELEQKSRLEDQKRLIEVQREIALEDLGVPKRGQILGFLSVLLIVGLCVCCLVWGHPEDARYIACTVIIGLASVFIIGKRADKTKQNKNPA
jgi:uncharacterized membrane protein